MTFEKKLAIVIHAIAIMGIAVSDNWLALLWVVIATIYMLKSDV